MHLLLLGRRSPQAAATAKAAADAARRAQPPKSAKLPKAAPLDAGALAVADPALAKRLAAAGDRVRALKAAGDTAAVAGAVADLNALKAQAQAQLASKA